MSRLLRTQHFIVMSGDLDAVKGPVKAKPDRNLTKSEPFLVRYTTPRRLLIETEMLLSSFVVPFSSSHPITQIINWTCVGDFRRNLGTWARSHDDDDENEDNMTTLFTMGVASIGSIAPSQKPNMICEDNVNCQLFAIRFYGTYVHTFEIVLGKKRSH